MTQVLLAIDTSSGTAVSVLVDGKIVSELYEDNSMQHAEHIGKLLAESLAKAGKKPSEVTAVAVGVGPAPFTGLRVGIAAAKLFAEGVQVPIFGVSSLSAIAFLEPLDEPTLILTDARRSEVYFALFHEKTKHGEPKVILGPGVKKQADLEAELLASGTNYKTVTGLIKASSVGLLALAQLAGGTLESQVLANYLRAPDAIPAKGKKVSG